MDDYWRDYLANAGMRLSPNLSGSYPPSAPTPPSDVDALREQVLDPWGLRHADPHLPDRVRRQPQRLLRGRAVQRDQRLAARGVARARRAPARVPDDPHARPRRGDQGGRARRLARRLRRRARAHPRRDALGQPPLPRPARGDRGEGTSSSPCTPGGGRAARRPRPASPTPTSRTTWATRSIVAQAQVLSLVTEGVFDRVPSLRVVLLECGFSWLPPLLWRFDKDWKAVWREVPWVKDKPSEYVRRHFRAATAPAQLPADPHAGRPAGRDARRQRHARLRQRLPARARRGQPRHAARGARRRRPRGRAARQRRRALRARPASSPPGPGRAARSAARGGGARGP